MPAVPDEDDPSEPPAKVQRREPPEPVNEMNVDPLNFGGVTDTQPASGAVDQPGRQAGQGGVKRPREPDLPRLFAYPKRFKSKEQEDMVFAEADFFGAVYRVAGPDPSAEVDVPSDATQARAATSLDQQPGELGDPTVVRTDRLVQLAAGGIIDAERLKSWAGTRKQAKGQNAVMKARAKAVANAAGRGGDSWEWLHLIAYSLGGPEDAGPQDESNLIAGTWECNSDMMIAEDMIKAVIGLAAKQHNQVHVSLEVVVDLVEGHPRLAREIRYTFVLQDDQRTGWRSITWRSTRSAARSHSKARTGRFARTASRAM